MCGFVGFSDRRAPEDKKEILGRMMDRIVHRGPDMAGDYADGEVGLGFRRLSIIDLTENGKQPMFNEDESVVVVFNGEIYNFQTLRDELLAKGHKFTSGADTEVIVHGYEEWGDDVVRRLRGMFTFAVWDIKAKRLLCARDIFGIKPLYYTQNAGGLLFGSEIKSFLEYPGFEKAVNPNALRAYLTLQYAAGEETFLKDVYSLPQGHYFVWENGSLTTTCYWDVDFAPEEIHDYEQWADIIDETVHESVAAHRISDVKVGSFLSGGVDSSYITACLMPENTFSVGFEQNKFNETNYAAELSEKLGVKNYKKLLTADECFDAFPDIQYHMDQPQANPSSVPLWFLAKLAREHVTVVLSGEGADEIFAGYDLYVDTPAMEKFKRVVPRGVRAALGRMAYKMPHFKGRNFLLKSSGLPELWFVGQADVFPPKQAKSILQPAYQNAPSPADLTAPVYARVADKPEVTKKQYLDMHLWLPGDILLKADKMCMAHSLELRVPFLDKVVIQTAAKIPSKYMIRGTENKAVFRHASNKTLPDEWANRPKKGFPVPIRYWLREEKYYRIVREYFDSEYAGEFFDKAAILRLLDDHYNGHANNARKIWVVFTFLTWYKRFFIDEAVA